MTLIKADKNGVSVQILSEHLTELFDTFYEKSGIPIDRKADDLTGQVFTILSEMATDVASKVQYISSQFSIDSSEDVFLDYAVRYGLIERQEATPTTVYGICYDNEGVVVGSGFEARDLSGNSFLSIQDTTITKDYCVDITFSFSVQDNTTYSIVLSGSAISTTTGVSATVDQIIDALIPQIDSEKYIVEKKEATLRVFSKNGYSPFSVSTSTNISIDEIGTPVYFVCSVDGSIACQANTLTIMDSEGVNRINNLADGFVGNDIEKDEELRDRFYRSGGEQGYATLTAIKSRLENNVDGVSNVTVYHNPYSIIDAFGMPRHSVEAIVEGGEDQAIANELLLNSVAAGIETSGNVVVGVNDGNGSIQECRFSRITFKYIWVKVDILALNGEESLVLDAIPAIKNAILSYGNKMGVGENVIPQRFYGSIYGATAGIRELDVSVAETNLPTDTPSYADYDIPISRNQKASFALVRIIVNGI